MSKIEEKSKYSSKPSTSGVVFKKAEASAITKMDEEEVKDVISDKIQAIEKLAHSEPESVKKSVVIGKRHFSIDDNLNANLNKKKKREKVASESDYVDVLKVDDEILDVVIKAANSTSEKILANVEESSANIKGKNSNSSSRRQSSSNRRSSRRQSSSSMNSTNMDFTGFTETTIRDGATLSKLLKLRYDYLIDKAAGTNSNRKRSPDKGYMLSRANSSKRSVRNSLYKDMVQNKSHIPAARRRGRSASAVIINTSNRSASYTATSTKPEEEENKASSDVDTFTAVKPRRASDVPKRRESDVIKTVKKVANRPFPLDDPIYKKPFQYGWKRELVYRAVPEASKEKGEVYYITPKGKKLRTKHEIGGFLHDDLTLNNFIFSKEPIGGSPTEEIIRSAKTYGNPKRPVMPSVSTDANTQKSQGISTTPSPTLKATTKTSSGRISTFSTARQYSNASNNKNNSSRAAPAQPVPQPVSPAVPRTKVDGCSIQCLLAMGVIPQLQCKICLNLYHHVCVGVDKKDANLDYYICKHCQISIAAEENKEGKNTAATSKSDSPKKIVPAESSTLNKVSKTIGEGASRKKVTFKIPNKKPPETSTPNAKKVLLPQGVAVIAGKKYIVIPKIALDLTASCVADNSNIVAASIAQRNNKALKQTPLPIIKIVENANPVSILKHSRITDNEMNISTINFTSNFFGNVAAGYTILMKTFRYLKVKELLRAGSVCKMWNEVANHTILWKTVRMKNSLVIDWSGLAQTLNKNSTKTLDLRKMLIIPDKAEEMWENYSQNIGVLANLQRIDLCRCPGSAIENLFKSNVNLKILNAIHIQGDKIDLTNIPNVPDLEEFRIRSLESMTMFEDEIPLGTLIKLRHLSVTNVAKISLSTFESIGNLVELESLELGMCENMPLQFPMELLPKLVKLERLRLEKVPEPCIFELVKTIARLPKLTQLELINSDVKPGFDVHFAECVNIKKLLLIPTYVAQSAATNNMIMNSVIKLKKTLKYFIWGVTTELLRVTDLYVDQCDAAGKSIPSENIPILKPVPGVENEERIFSKLANTIPQVEIVPLTSVQAILNRSLPNTKVKISKISFAATWKQNFGSSKNH